MAGATASPAGLFGHHAVAAPVLGHGIGHAIHATPVLGHGIGHVGHAVHAAPVVAHAVHAPVVHATPAYHAPAYHAEPDVVSPYTYTYAVADDYSKANFQASESSDGAGNAEGSYSVALPDGRIQHVNYHANGYDGYVADVTYDGHAQYPEAVVAHPVAHAAPVYHGAVHAAPVVAHAVPAVPLVAHHAPFATAHHGIAHLG